MLARAALATAVTRVVALLGGFATSILTARALGPEGRGSYYYVLVLGALVVQFGNFGLHASNTYLVARNRERFSQLLVNSVWISVVVGAVAAILVVAVSTHGEPATGHARLAYWAVVYSPATLVVLLVSNLLLGIGRYLAYNAVQLAVALLTLAGAVLAFIAKGSPATFVAATALAAASAAVLAVLLARGGSAHWWHFDRSLFTLGVHFASRAFAVGLLSFAALRASVFVVEHSAPAEQLGYYSISMQVADVLAMLPTSIATVLFPALIGSATAWQDTIKYLGITCLIMVPCCLLTAALAGPFVTLAFGAAFAPSVIVVQYALPGVLCLSLVTILSQFLASAGYPNAVIGIWVVAILAVVALAMWLVPQSGALGAAVSFSVTYLLVLVLMGSAALRHSGHAKAAL